MARTARTAAPLALMALIFVVSAQPDLRSSADPTTDFVLRKIAHMLEYALLWFLLLRAFDYRAPLAAAAIALGYAIGDEWHQTFVEGREGRPRDVAIDMAGVAIAWLIYRARTRRWEPRATAGRSSDAA